ncbi:MAG TPA: phosphoribosyltransferase family protein [Arenicellales bacterium]|nr:phosphoribosyltransferase family protein [Arenicellales bacterium]
MSEGYQYADRVEAGRLLAEKLAEKRYDNPVVLALPRGGVPVAAEVAKALAAPLDLVLVRKIGVPWQPELALAAVVDGPHPEVVINDDVWRAAGVSEEQFEKLKAKEMEEIDRRRTAYLGDRERAVIKGATAIVVDDGIATGATVRAALKALRRGAPEKLVLAVPVAPPDTAARLRREVDELVCLQTPEPFYAIGVFYRDFEQMSDDDVVAILDAIAAPATRDDDPA